MTRTQVSQLPKTSGGGGALRWAAGLVAILLTALLPSLLSHSSVAPRILGKYSFIYTLIILTHLAALILSLLVACRGVRRPDETRALPRAPGFVFWIAAWLAGLATALAVFLASGDNDFRNLAFAICGAGATVAWGLLIWGTRLRDLVNRTALAAGAALLVFGCFELLLNLFSPFGEGPKMLRDQRLALYTANVLQRPITEVYQSILTADPVLGYRQLPNQDRQVPVVDERDRPMVMKTDAWGFFNADFDPRRPYEVAFVGDSFTIGAWTGLLAEKTGTRVANFGVPGYCPQQYTEVLRRYALEVRPRIVFYCLYLNDASEAVVYDNWIRSGQDWFTYRGGLWFGPPSPHPGRTMVKYYLLRFFRTYGIVEYFRFMGSSEEKGNSIQPLYQAEGDVRLVFDRTSFRWHADVNHPTIRQGLALVRDSVARARDACNERKARFVVLVFPAKEWAHFEALQRCDVAEEPVGNLPRFYESLRQICEELEVEYYDFTGRFRQEIAATGKAYYREADIHWDFDGCVLAAEIASEVLRSVKNPGPADGEVKSPPRP